MELSTMENPCPHGFRIEHDLLGEREIPSEAYWGIHTLRAQENFPLSKQPVHPELIKALAAVKQACALTHLKLGALPEDIGNAIVQAAAEVASGALADQFPVDALQGGAGTSANMNVNEVIANRALEILGKPKGSYHYIHPNDHVNLGQSTNDVYPTALRIAALRLLQPAVDAESRLQGALQEKEAQFAGVLKVGRTEMQDAVPITLGQEFAAWAQAVARDWWRLYKAKERLRQVNLGGTAVGTGLGADPRYIYMVVDVLRDITGLNLARAENCMDVTQNADVFVEVSGFVKAAAVNLAKISADLRLLSSGPRAGIGEIRLPELQAGSSIMPGKVNPVITEAVTQAAYQIIANDTAITLAAQSGQLELNAFLPLIAHNLLQSLELLASSAAILREKCIAGIEANVERCRELLNRSIAVVTALVPHIGYEKATEVAREAAKTGETVQAVVLRLGLMPPEALQAALSTEAMTKPGIPGAGKLRRLRTLGLLKSSEEANNT
jgi:aspartate ammonia-lyase